MDASRQMNIEEHFEQRPKLPASPVRWQQALSEPGKTLSNSFGSVANRRVDFFQVLPASRICLVTSFFARR